MRLVAPTTYFFSPTPSQRLSADGQDLPLTELFLEGPQPVADRTFLLDALSKTNLKRLALYQIQMAKPQLFSEIATALPQLEALTIVQGDCSGAVLWPAPLVRRRLPLPPLSRH